MKEQATGCERKVNIPWGSLPWGSLPLGSAPLHGIATTGFVDALASPLTRAGTEPVLGCFFSLR